MFIGHFAAGFAAKRIAPRASLGTLFLSVQLIDLIWPVCLLLHLEHVRIAPGITVVTPLDFYEYPITHSLIGVLAWSTIFGAAHFVLRRDPRRAWVLGIGVFSHWILDAIVHRPDLPLLPGGTARLGLGLWNSLAGTIVLECGIYAAGCALYLASTAPRDRIGRYGAWTLMAFLAAVYAANLLGPPPPGVVPIALAGLAMGGLLIPWALWVDRHREVLDPKIPISG